MEEEIYLTDLIDVDTLQRIQDAFSNMTGMAALTADANGVPVTKGSNFTDFCSKYTRKSEDGHIRCEQCDKFGAEDSWKKGGPTGYYCHAGLIDYAAPILAGNKMVGSFIGGQVLTEPPDRDNIIQIAWDLGIDPETLWNAAKKVQIRTKEEIDRESNFLFTVANVLSDMAYGKYRTMQANKEIARANNMKSDFLANMSHEIRTPMNAVIGMAEMALREELSPAAREYICQIKNSGKALLTIINDILDFSKIESGKMDIIPVEYEPMSIINDISDIIMERLADKDVELILDIEPDIPHFLLGDNIRIKQILLNLANNAAKFTNKGQVLIHFKNKFLPDKKVLLCCSVEDTGIGIKEADLAQIFDSFQQVDSKRNRNIEGTGLGLAISRRLVNLMNGSIHAESTYGTGSVFYFEVPQSSVIDTPNVILENPESVCATLFIKSEYIRQGLHNDFERLGVECKEISSFSEINILPDKENFLFMERECLTPEMTDYFGKNPELTAAILFSFNTPAENFEFPNMLMVKKPLCTVSEIQIFKRENINIANEYSDTVNVSFIAPSAEVLIVDDNAINLTVAVGLLAPLKMSIDTAADGKEAIDMVSNKHYDLILMDHMMPDLDGVETTHIIRRFHPEYNDVPIIALTANAVGGMKEMFLEEGMNDFVPKPIELKNLISKVAMWLPVEKIEKTDTLIISSQGDETETSVGDLDTASAVKLLGSKELFWTVLKDYYRVIEKKAALIKEYEKNEDWAAYTIEVHALKSASKQIGAISLSEQAAAMEKAGNARSSKLIHECTNEMLDHYLSYLSVLEPFCREKETESTQGEITETALLVFFRDMRDAIEDLDMDKMEAVIHDMSEYSYDEEQKALFMKLKEGVEELDTDTCEQILEKWENSLS